MIIDQRDYPSIHWRWRVFSPTGFMGYINATCEELSRIAATFQCVVDLEHASLELL